VAIAGKMISVGGPALSATRCTSVLLPAMSMVPRAEIALAIMRMGYRLGSRAVPDNICSAILAPVVLGAMIKRWPQNTTR
jgi:hypothetical protein